jgi:hypothetical protein
VRGLQQALDRIGAGDPALAAACTQLRGMLARFELEDFKNALAEDADAPSA